MRRLPPVARLGVALAVVAAVLGAIVYVVVKPAPAAVTVDAHFATAPGLYVGNQVDILGMPVGHVTAIRPGPAYVTVTISVPRSIPVPADAHAVIMAPNVVNDRYVELTPVYRSGPALANGAVIPQDRTAVPVSVDEIIASLDQLSVALGPSGANSNGALSDLLKNAARAFGGNGDAVHSTLTSLGHALGALSSQGPNLTALLDNLGNFTHVASQYTDNYKSFANNLATVSTDLAGDNVDLAGALSNLQQALGELAAFIHANSGSLGTSVSNLSTFAATVAAKQQVVGQAFAALPVALQNLSAAFDPNAPGGPALRTRLDPLGGSAAYSSSVCGSPLLRLLLLVPNIAQAKDPNPNVDLACGVNGVLASLPVPPGASAGPNLSLSALVGGGR